MEVELLNLVSDCCGAPVVVEGDDDELFAFGETNYYTCVKCGEPCDMRVAGGQQGRGVMEQPTTAEQPKPITVDGIMKLIDGLRGAGRVTDTNAIDRDCLRAALTEYLSGR